MEQTFESIDDDEESAEERLAELIKLAGADARTRNKKIMDRHFKKLRAVCEEAARHRDSISK